MSYYGYADFDRPITVERGRIYYPYGGGPFLLTPYRCSAMGADDGRVNFRLDLVRGATPADPSYAMLELRLTADYAIDRALPALRADHPDAALTRCVLTEWTFQLAQGPATASLPQELRDGIALASNGLGSARLILPLTIESGLLIESMIRDGQSPFPVIATARIDGVSPRVPAVVRFRGSGLLAALAGVAAQDGSMPRTALVNFFTRDTASLPMEITGTIAPDQVSAFAETMADRVVNRFGSYAPPSGDTSDPVIRLSPTTDTGETDIIWSLSEPFLTSRLLVLSFDLLSDIRTKVQTDTDGAFVIYHSATALPSFGPSVVTVYCNLPIQRVGVEALGATLTAPPNPPNRPQSTAATVEFTPPTDMAKAALRLAPGEPLTYSVSTFVVVADEQGVRQIDGPEHAGSDAILRLTPDDFPMDFALVEMGADLAEQATVTGTCRYAREGSEYLIPFTLDSGRLTASIALPKDRTSVNVQCAATDRQGGGVLYLGPFDTPEVRLSLASFPEYGTHTVQIECEFDGRAPLYAIDLLAVGDPDIASSITVLAFTPAQPMRTYTWFARSPFSPGFRYRPHQDGGVPAAWHSMTSPVEHLTIQPESAQPQIAHEVIGASRYMTSRMRPNGNGHISESARLVGRSEAEATGPRVLPLSPEPEPTDLLLYTNPSDASRKYYIPRYALAVQTVSGRQEYRIAMVQAASGATLSLHLTRSPAGEIADAARDAREFPHDITLRLEFLSSPPYTARKVLEFEEVTRNAGDVSGTIRFATLEERDEVYRALTDPAHDSRLIVRRGIDVALPQVTGPQRLPPIKIGDIPPIDILPPRPKPMWAVPLPSDGDPRPNRFGTNVIISSPALTLAGLFSTDPPGTARPNASLATTLAGVNVASVTAFGTRFETTALSLRARDVVIDDSPGPIVIGDWPRKPPIKWPPKPVVSLPTPVLAFTGREDGGGFVRCKLSVTNWSEFSADFFQASPDLPPCGRNTSASRTWVDIFDAATDARLYGFCALSDPANLNDLWFAAPPNAVPAQVYVQLVDRRANVTRRSNVVETTAPRPTEPTYVPGHRDLDNVVDPLPFTFLPTLHDYIFLGIQPGSGDSRLVRFRYPWLNTFHTYLQDASRPEVVYVFPDEFRIARRADPPFTPFITVRVSGQAGAADASVVFDYIVAPHTNAERLTAARAALLADPQFGASDVQFQPFVTNDVRFFIDRPTQQGTAHEERDSASLVLQGSLKDTLVMTLPDFQLVFDAMYRDTASLFLGRVEVDVPGEDTQVIPFSARMTELEGELFVSSAVANAAGGVDVTLTNAIESPVRADALPASMSRDGATVPASIQGITLPVASLAPASTLQMTVTPATPLGGSGTPQVAFNLDAVTVLPDPALILDSILDRTTLQYYDMITVKGIASLFTPVADRPNDQVMAILVEFEGGGTGELNASTLESAVRIDYPVDDVILRRPVSTTYRYTVTVVRADGRQDRDVEPRQGTARTFFVSVTK